MADAAAAFSTARLGGVYTDEPLSHIRVYQPPVLPGALRTARALERALPGRMLTREQLFLQQARILADFTDDCPYPAKVLHYFPTYAALNDRELRGYFTWRARWRAGLREKAPLSYAYLYVYELLHLVGCADAADGYEKLGAFDEAFGALDPQIHRHVRAWLRDFVVYYGLSPALLADTTETKRDAALYVLSALDGHTDEEILRAADVLSDGAVDRSRFFKQEPALAAAVLAGTLRQTEAHYRTETRTDWITHYFGMVRVRRVRLFEAAVFCDKDAGGDRTAELSPLRQYAKRGGAWTVYGCGWENLPYKRLSKLIRTADSLTRCAFGFGHPIQPAVDTKWLHAAIQKEIQTQKAERERQRRIILQPDLSLLRGIRAAADETGEKLLTDEERDPPAAAAPPPPAEPTAAPTQAPACGFTELSETEARFLRGLLTGIPAVLPAGTLPTLLCDAVNEKLFDRFGDTVLEDGAPVEDYAAELKKGLGL